MCSVVFNAIYITKLSNICDFHRFIVSIKSSASEQEFWKSELATLGTFFFFFSIKPTIKPLNINHFHLWNEVSRKTFVKQQTFSLDCFYRKILIACRCCYFAFLLVSVSSKFLSWNTHSRKMADLKFSFHSWNAIACECEQLFGKNLKIIWKVLSEKDFRT